MTQVFRTASPRSLSLPPTSASFDGGIFMLLAQQRMFIARKISRSPPFALVFCSNTLLAARARAIYVYALLLLPFCTLCSVIPRARAVFNLRYLLHRSCLYRSAIFVSFHCTITWQNAVNNTSTTASPRVALDGLRERVALIDVN